MLEFAFRNGEKKLLTKVIVGFNHLPNKKFFDWSTLKAFADNKINLTQKQKFFLGLVENIVGKRENAGYQHFLFFSHNVFKRLYFQGCYKSDCVVKF